MGPNLCRFSLFLSSGETRVHLLGADTPIGPPGPSARVRAWRDEEGSRPRRWVWIRTRSAGIRDSFPPVGSRIRRECTARANKTRSQGASAGLKSRTLEEPELGVQGGNTGDTRVGEQPHPAPKGTRPARPAPGALPFPESHPTLSTRRSRNSGKRNCKPVSRSLETASQAPRRVRTPRTQSRMSGPSEWSSRRKVALRCSRAPPGFFTRNSLQSRFQEGVGGAPTSSPFRPPPAPPHEKGNLGPARILGMFFVIGCMLTSTAQLRAKSQVSGR